MFTAKQKSLLKHTLKEKTIESCEILKGENDANADSFNTNKRLEYGSFKINTSTNKLENQSHEVNSLGLQNKQALKRRD